MYLAIRTYWWNSYLSETIKHSPCSAHIIHYSWGHSQTARAMTLKNHVAKETWTVLFPPFIHPSIHSSIYLSVSSISVSVDWGPVSWSAASLGIEETWVTVGEAISLFAPSNLFNPPPPLFHQVTHLHDPWRRESCFFLSFSRIRLTILVWSLHFRHTCPKIMALHIVGSISSTAWYCIAIGKGYFPKFNKKKKNQSHSVLLF